MITFLDIPGLRKLLTVEPSFGSAMKSLAAGLGLDADAILGVMSLESGLNPQATNPTSKATGLIQWMPATAKALGTTVDLLRGMTAVQQLEYVKRYLAPLRQKIREDEPGDYYMAVFMPAYIGAPRETVLGEKGSQEILKGTGVTKDKIYFQNTAKGAIGTGLDTNADGKITVGDVMVKNEQRVAAARSKPALEVAEFPLADPRPSAPAPQSLSQPWQSSGGRFDLPVLRIGARGTAVTLAQLSLDLPLTGVYTDAMALKVREAQRAWGLTDDAVIGPNTWQRIAELPAPMPKVSG